MNRLYNVVCLPLLVLFCLVIPSSLQCQQNEWNKHEADTGNASGRPLPFMEDGIVTINPKTGNVNIQIPLLTLPGTGTLQKRFVEVFNSNGLFADYVGNGPFLDGPLRICIEHTAFPVPTNGDALVDGGPGGSGMDGAGTYMFGCDGSGYVGGSTGSLDFSSGGSFYHRDGASLANVKIGSDHLQTTFVYYADGTWSELHSGAVYPVIHDRNGNTSTPFGGAPDEALGYYDQSGTLHSLNDGETYPALPNSHPYQFEVYGQSSLIKTVHKPLGGYERFVYATEDITSDGTPAFVYPITDRFVSRDGVTEEHYVYSRTYEAGSGSSACLAVNHSGWLNNTCAQTTTITNPDGSKNTLHWPFAPAYATYSQPDQESLVDASGRVVSMISRTFVARPGGSANIPYYLPETETVSQDGAVQLTRHYVYDSYGNVTQLKESDAHGNLLRQTDTTYWASQHSEYAAPDVNLIHLKASELITGADGTTKATTYGYDEDNLAPPSGYTSWPRGNLTSVQVGRSIGTGVTTRYWHDQRGNVIKSQDPNGNYTYYGYGENPFYGSTPPGCGNPSAATLLTSVTNPAGQITRYTYYACTGQLAQVMTPNDIAQGRSGTITQYSSTGTVASIDYPDGGHKSFDYGFGLAPEFDQTQASAPSSFVRKTTTLANPNPNIVTREAYDSSGRIVASLTSDGLVSRRKYGVMDRMVTSSLAQSSVDYTYDALGRVVKEQNESGGVRWNCYRGVQTASQPNCRSDLSGLSNSSTWMDSTEWGATNNRQDSMDSLGRLIAITEPDPNQGGAGAKTVYGYDGLNNLTSVVQNGTGQETPRTRSFTYDSLSRLASAYNPETGLICYGYSLTFGPGGNNQTVRCNSYYDNNGNLLQKTDARGVTTNYSYDALNRLTGKTYSDGTPSAQYFYDVAPPWLSDLQNVVGRLTNTASGGAASAFSYDPMGRMKRVWQSTPATLPNGEFVSAEYDLAGNMRSFTYPDGRTVTQGYDSAGRLTSSAYTGWGANPKNSPYLSVPTGGYDAAGHLINATMGNNVTLAASYDNRERLHTLGYSNGSTPLWGKQYAYFSNSNLQSTTDLISRTNRQFTYDSLNRLTSAVDTVSPSATMTSGTSTSGITCTNVSGTGASSGANPQWLDEDDSNLLVNTDDPGVGNFVVAQNSAVAPDGSMTAMTLTSGSGNDSWATFSPGTLSYALGSTAVTGSVWLKSLSGNQTIAILIYTGSAQGTQFTAQKSIQLTSSWQQYELSGMVDAATTNLLFQIGGGNSIGANQVIALWNPDLVDSGSAGVTITNFIPYSQRLTAGSWNNNLSQLSDNIDTAPDGSPTAARVTASPGSTDSYISAQVSNPSSFSSVPVTGSVWLRSTTGNRTILLTLTERNADTWTTLGGQYATLTSDWQRFQASGTTMTALSSLTLQIGGANTLQAGQSIEVWGAQLEMAPSAGPYVPTGGATASTNTGLTNLLPYSDWKHWTYSQGMQITNASVAAPDGSNTAAEITATNADSWSSQYLKNPALYDGQTVTASIFLRSPSGSNNTVLIGFAVGTAQGAPYITTPVQVGSEWRRYTITTTLPTGLQGLLFQVGGGNTFTTGQVIDAWGAQVEISSHAGSFIATNGIPILTGKEPTNLLQNSEQIVNWDVANSAYIQNSATAPNNTQTAVTVTANNGSPDSYIGVHVPNPSYYDGQTMTGSVYLRVPSGTLTTNLYLTNIGDQGWGVPASKSITVTTTWQRFTVTGTNQNGLSLMTLQVGGGSTFTSGQLQIWGLQMAVGTDPAPYSPTNCTPIDSGSGQTIQLAPNGLNQAFRYDSFGNILQNGSFNASYDANNRMVGWAYDASGNLLSNGLTTFAWDAESRLSASGGATYYYDADGNRIEKQGVGITDTIYFGGRPVSRRTAGQWTDLIYGPNGLLAEVPGTENGAPTYRLLDHLGNQVGSADSNGTFSNPLDYTPYGMVFSGVTNDPYMFTGKERDAESGLDYFGARYYASSIGRFMSPDWAARPEAVPYSQLDNPQSLNLYGYVQNNPLNRSDDDGHETQTYYGNPSYTAQQANDKRISPTEWKVWGGVAITVGALSGASEIGAGVRASWGFLGRTATAAYLGASVLWTPTAQKLISARDTVSNSLSALKDAAASGQIDIPGGTANLIRSASNAVSNSFTNSDINGAIKQSVTGIEAGGDHVQELQGVGNSLTNLANRLGTALNNPTLSTQTRTLYENTVNAIRPAVEQIKQLNQ